MSINDIFIIIICAAVGTVSGHFLGMGFCKLYDYIKTRRRINEKNSRK